MAILQRRRTVFSLSNSEVMSNSAPTTEAGITKSEGHDGFFIYLPIYAIFEYGNKIIGEIYVMYGLKTSKEKSHLKMSIVKHWIQNIDEIPPKQTLCVYDVSDLGDSSGKLSLALKSLLSKGIQLWIMNSEKPIKLNSKESYLLTFKIIDFHRTERSKNQKKAMRRAKQSGSVLGRKSKFSEEEKSTIIREKILSDKSAHEIANDYGPLHSGC